MKKMRNLVLGLVVLVTLTACGNSEKDYQAAMDTGNDAIAAKDYDKAITSFEKALTYKKSDAEAQDLMDQVKSYQKATKLEEDAKLDEAKKAAQEVIEMKNGSSTLADRGQAVLDEITTLEENEEKYQEMYDQAKKEYAAKEYDAAGGTIQILLGKDLDHKVFATLKTDATTLKEQIVAAQKEQMTAIQPGSKYSKERNSKLIAKEFLEATGQEITQATDEDITTWLTQKNENETRPAPGNPEQTEADKKLAVQQAVVKITGYSDASNANQYYVTALSDDLYQVEIRSSQGEAGTEISNMVGMFQYKPSTKELSKMDPVTGEYSPFVAQ
ncbi:hypothetical protein [Isobaculum melis]|uniref:Uncharacterized protein n=1 Tax=Isobaculum melis TaxID=142588 RepID=A0A1H9TZ39_9LACT|nr:hypothetical protein [Isobaculum melis]SES02013.1 hypothetical protein SAMN04488559_1184 [Isobaculum melis]